MNVTTDDLLTLIGAKEAELLGLRRRVAELEAAAETPVLLASLDGTED